MLNFNLAKTSQHNSKRPKYGLPGSSRRELQNGGTQTVRPYLKKVPDLKNLKILKKSESEVGTLQQQA